MSIKTFTLLAGVFFVAAGIFGFIPDFTSYPAFSDPDLILSSSHSRLFGLFPVNAVHNFAHIALGLWALLAYSRYSSAKIFNQSNAVIYAVLAVMGLIPNFNTFFGVMPIHGHDVWLHGP